MCNSIRYQLQYRTTQPVRVVTPPKTKTVKPATKKPKEKPGQAPLGADEISLALEMLSLKPRDVVCDVGCGDGRILIEAVKRCGCRAVGVEVDAEQVKKARAAVSKAEKSGEIPVGRIRILHMDAVHFSPRRYGITKGVAYLFPETLEKLRPMLSLIPSVVTPFHQIPGIEDHIERERMFMYVAK